MTFLDTGYFIALLNPRDELHATAVLWSERLSDSFVVTEHVLWETINFFSQPADRPKALALMDHLDAETAVEIIPATPALFRAGLNLHRERVDKHWSLTDCISFVLMRERSILQALAFDQHFEQAGFVALLRREP